MALPQSAQCSVHRTTANAWPWRVSPKNLLVASSTCLMRNPTMSSLFRRTVGPLLHWQPGSWSVGKGRCAVTGTWTSSISRETQAKGSPHNIVLSQNRALSKLPRASSLDSTPCRPAVTRLTHRQSKSSLFEWGRSSLAVGLRNSCAKSGVNQTTRTLDVQAVNKSIQSSFFWAYRGMIGALSETLDHMLHWSESCSCHKVPLSSLRSPHAATQSYFQLRYRMNKCPLQGCRAADFANGRFTLLLRGFLETSLANVAMTYTRQLSEADRKCLLDDCAQAFSPVSLVLSNSVQFRVGLQLPSCNNVTSGFSPMTGIRQTDCQCQLGLTPKLWTQSPSDPVYHEAVPLCLH